MPDVPGRPGGTRGWWWRCPLKLTGASTPRRSLPHPAGQPGLSCGGHATSRAARTRSARRGTGSGTCCRIAIPSPTSSCSPARRAPTRSRTPAAGSPAAGSPSTSSGHRRRPGWSSGTRARPRPRPSPPRQRTRPGQTRTGAGCGSSMNWPTTGERPLTPGTAGSGSTSSGRPGAARCQRPPAAATAAYADITAMREAFPGTTIWWGHQTRTWWAALPGADRGRACVSAPTRGGLCQLLAATYPSPGSSRDHAR